MDGSLGGLIGKINRSETDIGVTPFAMSERSAEDVDFCYPFKFEDYTFVTRKARYVPQIFGMFRTLSLFVGIIIACVYLAMMLINYFFLKWKFCLDKILLYVFAILMKQNAVITLLSLTEKCLIFSWVVGSMFLCLSYESVFLSFLSFFPVNEIKDLSDLASAVKKGDYHCLSAKHEGVAWHFLNGKEKCLRFIGRDLEENGLSNGDIVATFNDKSRKQNLALFLNIAVHGYYASSEKNFVSVDRFFQQLGSMMIQKGFCCKHFTDVFVHRMMASSIYFKIMNDGNFLDVLKCSLRYPDTDDCLRKSTLTDVAPAFIFLLFGYFVSFLALL